MQDEDNHLLRYERPGEMVLKRSRSDDVETYNQEHGPVDISDLTLVEMRSLLGRRRRKGNIDPQTEIKVFATFEEDIRQRYLICHSLPEGLARGTVNLLSVHSQLPIRTLDAMHLMIAKEIHAEVIATADRVMVVGATAMGFSVVRFDRPVHR